MEDTEQVTAGANAPANDVQDWQAEAAKWKAQAEANASKAAAFDAQEEAAKTEMQKLMDAKAAAEQTAALATQQLLRSEVARAKNVPAELLVGDSKEQLEASAKALLDFQATFVPTAPTSHGQGKVGDPPAGQPEQLTRASLAGMTPEQIMEAKTAGQLNSLLGIK